MTFEFAAHVGEIVLDGGRFAFALGDGSIAWEDGPRRQVHDGPVLCAAAHLRGPGVISGGDDGRLAASTPAASDLLAEAPGKWIDALAVAPASGLIAFASGRQVRVLDAADRAFGRVFDHERSVAGLAFEAKGRRLAAATYGGVALWYARIGEQKPVMLRWAGSHLEPVFSPDGRFVVSAMQEPALHGWRLTDSADLAMSGYQAKVRSLAFVDQGRWLATSGANGVVLWPFAGAGGPMGKQAAEVGFDAAGTVARLAGLADSAVIAAALDDGRIWAYDIATDTRRILKPDPGPPISALLFDRSGRLAWGDESGAAGVFEVD